MSKFDSRARCRFAPMRKRRAFGPRRSSKFIKLRHYAKQHRDAVNALIDNGTLGSVTDFRFVTSSMIRTPGKSTFAEQWKLATVAAEVAGRLYEDTTPEEIAAANRKRQDEWDRAMYDAIRTGAGISIETFAKKPPV